jgi:YHS domain-containing protein
MSFPKPCWGLLVVGLFGCIAGCEQPATTPPTTTTQPAAEDPAMEESSEPAPMPTEGNPAAEPGVEGDEASAAPGAGDQSEAAMIQAAFASLSPEDRVLAEKQKICPVGGGPLGSMGTPIKVDVSGQEVFVCCEHCEEPLKSDPNKFLAAIGLEPKDEDAVQ